MAFGFDRVDSLVLILFVMYHSDLGGISYYMFCRGFPTPSDSGWLILENQGTIKIKKLLFVTTKNNLQELSSPPCLRAWENRWIFIDFLKIIKVRVTLVVHLFVIIGFSKIDIKL